MIRGPVEFMMGSPDNEPNRYDNEVQHRVRIGRTYAIATRELTIGQYRRFLDRVAPGPKPVDRMPSALRRAASPDCPVGGVDWYDAARYCNWLSQQEGIPQSQWCYPLEIKEGMSPGRRLPRPNGLPASDGGGIGICLSGGLNLLAP